MSFRSLRILTLFIALILIASSALAADYVQMAKDVMANLAAGDYEAARKDFADTLLAQLSAEDFGLTWDGIELQSGTFDSVTGFRVDTTSEEMSFVWLDLACAYANLQSTFVFDENDQIMGILFAPPSQPKPESQPARPHVFKENSQLNLTEVTFGDSAWQITGNLYLPEGESPFPAVVLVHGSGPQDRFETIGSNRPFYDLAAGLVGKGIAVLTYDKRTFTYGAKFMNMTSYTVQEETVDDAVYAVDFLAARDDVNSDDIFMLGHSLGAMLAPRVADGTDNLTGLILLSPNARPLEDLLLEQLELVDSIASAAGERSGFNINWLRERFNFIKSDSLTSETSMDELPFRIPADYWLDLRNYEPHHAAADVKLPMLVMHGERDYQVPETDFEMWREALAERDDVAFKSYPNLNHLFMPGEGPVNQSEYLMPQNIPQFVIDDIANFIKSH